MVMTPQPGRRGSVLGPVLLAAFFLAVIGASAGYLYAHRVAGDLAAPVPRTPGVPAATTTAAAPSSPSSPSGTASASPNPLASDPLACPAPTERAAREAGSPGALHTVLYVDTGRSEVWICRDLGDHLWYQGRLIGEPFDTATSASTLFLGDVVPEGDGYVATNRDAAGQTRYHVSRGYLILQFLDAVGTEKSRRVEAVRSARP
jgi:hypothetical protein